MDEMITRNTAALTTRLITALGPLGWAIIVRFSRPLSAAILTIERDEYTFTRTYPFVDLTYWQPGVVIAAAEAFCAEAEKAPRAAGDPL